MLLDEHLAFDEGSADEKTDEVNDNDNKDKGDGDELHAERRYAKGRKP